MGQDARTSDTPAKVVAPVVTAQVGPVVESADLAALGRVGGALHPDSAAAAAPTRAQVMALQRTAGNQAVNRLIGPRKPMSLDVGRDADVDDEQSGFADLVAGLRHEAAAAAAPEAPPDGSSPAAGNVTVQRFWDKAMFKAKTRESWRSSRGTTLTQIEKMLEIYAKLEYGEVNKRSGSLEEIKYATELYITGHAEDPSRQKRMVGMIEFSQVIEQEILDVNALKRDMSEGPAAAFVKSDDVHEESAQHKKLRAKFEANSDTFFTKLAPVISGAKPPAGGSNELEIDVNIPVVAVPGLIVGGNLKFTIETDDDGKAITMRTDLALTSGFHVPGFTIKGKLGGYIEVSGPDAGTLCKLLSHGMYQRFRESDVVPSGLTNAFWGGSTSDIIGFGRAEAWAAEVENEVFGPLAELRKKAEAGEGQVEMIGLEIAELEARLEGDLARAESDEEKEQIRKSAGMLIGSFTAQLEAAQAQVAADKAAAEDSVDSYVETGGATGAVMEGDLGIANAKHEFEATTGRRMDAESVEANKGVGTTRKKADQGNKLTGAGSGIGGTKTIGKGTYTLSANSSFEFGPFTVEYGWKVSSITDATRTSKVKTSEFTLAGTAKTAMKGLVGVFAKGIPSLAQAAKKFFSSKLKEDGAEKTGMVAGQVPGITNAILQMNDPASMTEAFTDTSAYGKGADTAGDPTSGDLEGRAGFEGKAGLKLGGSLTFEDNVPSGELSLSLVETSELVPTGVQGGSTTANLLKVALAKNKKLIAWKFPGGVAAVVKAW